MRVLLLEDDEGVAGLITTYLMNKAEIYTVTKIQEALDVIDHYDVVLMDLNIDGSDGLQTLRVILEVAAIPIVIVTGMENEDLAKEAVRQGAQDFLVKSQFNSIQLWHAILYATERFNRGSTRNKIKTLEEIVESKAAINEMILREVRELKRLYEALLREHQALKRIVENATKSGHS